MKINNSVVRPLDFGMPGTQTTNLTATWSGERVLIVVRCGNHQCQLNVKCWRPFVGVRPGCARNDPRNAGWDEYEAIPDSLHRPPTTEPGGVENSPLQDPAGHKSTPPNLHINARVRPSQCQRTAPQLAGQRSLTLWSLENQSSTINNRSAAGTRSDIENRAHRWAGCLRLVHLKLYSHFGPQKMKWF